MSKHYNLTVTDDNGKSVTTSNTSTEHPEEVLRMMQLAGMQSEPQCGMESVEENEYQATPANDKLDLDDYSKKSPESISKQPKKLQPSRGDNPLEYSLDENEIFESLMNEFETVNEEVVKIRAVKDKEHLKLPTTGINRTFDGPDAKEHAAIAKAQFEKDGYHVVYEDVAENKDVTRIKKLAGI